MQPCPSEAPRVLHALTRRGMALALAATLSLVLSACGGGGDDTAAATTTPPSSNAVTPTPSPSPAPAPTYSVGGTVAGLGSGLSVKLLNNGGDAVTVTANGNFQFPTALASGAQYAATVGTRPSGNSARSPTTAARWARPTSPTSP